MSWLPWRMRPGTKTCGASWVRHQSSRPPIANLQLVGHIDLVGCVEAEVSCGENVEEARVLGIAQEDESGGGCFGDDRIVNVGDILQVSGGAVRIHVLMLRFKAGEERVVNGASFKGPDGLEFIVVVVEDVVLPSELASAETMPVTVPLSPFRRMGRLRYM